MGGWSGSGRISSNSNSELELKRALSSQIIQCLSNVALFVSFRDPVRCFVSEGVAKAAGFRRDNSLGGDASASSPQTNCLVVNRNSDLPQPQFSWSRRRRHYPLTTLTPPLTHSSAIESYTVPFPALHCALSNLTLCSISNRLWGLRGSG